MSIQKSQSPPKGANLSLKYTQEAVNSLLDLAENKAMKAQYKAVRKALKFLDSNPRHTGLNTHKMKTMKTNDGKDLWEAYAQNKTPGAYRIFFQYSDTPGDIEIINVMKHPE